MESNTSASTPRRPHTTHVTAEGNASHFCPAMSTASEPRAASVECRNPDCDEYGPRWSFRDGKYCSTRCEVEHEGYKVLSTIKHDHRFCFTCGTKLKIVVRAEGRVRGRDQRAKGDPDDPPETRFVYRTPPENYVGLQGTTAAAAWGEKAHPKDDRYVRSGAVCTHCGSTDHRERVAELFGPNWGEYADRLLRRVAAETDTEVDADAFWRTYDGENFEYAVGVAVSEGDS